MTKTQKLALVRQPRRNLRTVELVWAVSLATFGGRSAAAEQTPTPVAVLPLHFTGELVSADRSVLSQRLQLGLKATQLAVVSGGPVRRALGQKKGTTCDAECRRGVAAALEVRYVVGGEVEGKHDNYRLRLWAADGYTGKTLAEVERACDICGVTELANTMELAASALHVKLKAMRKGVAQIQVTTDPPGAAITLDGDLVGKAPRALELPPGEHEIALSLPGHRAERRRVQAVAGIREHVEVTLQRQSSQAWRRPVGWGLIGAGLIGAVVGGVLFGIDGEQTDCVPGDVLTQRCSSVRQTSAGGWVSAGLGVAAIAGGVYLILTGKPLERADVAVLPEGAGVSVRGRF